MALSLLPLHNEGEELGSLWAGTGGGLGRGGGERGEFREVSSGLPGGRWLLGGGVRPRLGGAGGVTLAMGRRPG